MPTESPVDCREPWHAAAVVTSYSNEWETSRFTAVSLNPQSAVFALKDIKWDWHFGAKCQLLTKSLYCGLRLSLSHLSKNRSYKSNRILNYPVMMFTTEYLSVYFEIRLQSQYDNLRRPQSTGVCLPSVFRHRTCAWHSLLSFQMQRSRTLAKMYRTWLCH